MTPSAKSAQQPLALYLAFLGLLALVIGVAVAKLTGTFERDTGIRYFGILMGLLMVVAGNGLPKLLQPGVLTGGALRAAERLAGWFLVLGGLLIIGLWLWAPEINRTLATSATGLAIFATVLLTTLLITRGTPSTRILSPEMRRAVTNRRALFHILHAVMWVFAIFLASEVWGNDIMGWLMVGFAVSLGILDVWLAMPLRKSNTPAE